MNLRDRSVAASAELILHFHRFHDHERLARADEVSWFDVDPDDLARHRRDDALGANGGPAPCIFSAPAAVQLYRDRRGADADRHMPDCRFVRNGDFVAGAWPAPVRDVAFWQHLASDQ